MLEDGRHLSSGQRHGRRYRGDGGMRPPGRRNRGGYPPGSCRCSHLINGHAKYEMENGKSGEFLILGVGLVGPTWARTPAQKSVATSLGREAQERKAGSISANGRHFN